MKKACEYVREVNRHHHQDGSNQTRSSYVLRLQEKPKQPEVQIFSQHSIGVKQWTSLNVHVSV